jgi:D-alanine transfer protein
MVHVHAKAGLPHLFPALITCGLVAAILLAGRTIAIHVEESTISATAPEAFSLKNQGLAFQRAAARAPDVLPLYGSSELLMGVPDRASAFFRTAPTGFQLSPVGKAGTTSMIMLQNIGALGSELHGKKVAISLSPIWFWGVIRPYWYEGNFSLLAASKLAFGSALDFELKREIASRMLDFPRTLAKNPLLEFALRRLASGKPLDRIVFYILWPLAKIQNAILDLQDHFAALIYIRHEAKPAPTRHPKVLDWPKLIAKAGEQEPADSDENKKGKASGSKEQTIAGSRDEWFRERVNEAREWGDFELLLSTLARIDARPLLLSMPLDGQYYDRVGVSRPVRECYYQRMRALARQYNFALVEFEEHDEDPTFLYRRVQDTEPVPSTHLAAKGWMFYNRVLDDFFHGRVPRS